MTENLTPPNNNSRLAPVALENRIEQSQTMVQKALLRMLGSWGNDWLYSSVRSDVLKDINNALKNDTRDLQKENEQLNHELLIDPLTGALNRKGFLQKLGNEIEVASKNEQELAVLFVDGDRFKLINDCLGHEYGDDVIRIITAAIRTTLKKYASDHENGEAQEGRTRPTFNPNLKDDKRKTGKGARLGGDEIAALIRADKVDQLDMIFKTAQAFITREIDKLKDKYRAKSITDVTSIDEREEIESMLAKIVPTLSVGVVTIKKPNAENTDELMKDLLAVADSGLYLAKEDGKNRYVVKALEADYKNAIEEAATIQSPQIIDDGLEQVVRAGALHQLDRNGNMSNE
jgi:GGDEF domain-containing protein